MNLQLHHPDQDLNPDNHTIQEIHDAPWISTRSLNTSPGLATPGGASLHQCCCRSHNFVSIVANARFSIRDRLIYGLDAGYLF